MPLVFLGVGSNLGDRAGNLRLAERLLRETPGVDSVCLSPVYETEPVGPVAQGRFLNAVLAVETTLPPRALLQRMRAIEQEAGRASQEHRVRWGPRELDLDLLLYGGLVIDEPGLTVPHPRMHERAFVLRPLCDVAAEVEHPVLKRTVRQMLEALKAQGCGA